MAKRYHTVVIGSGVGGYVAALHLGHAGKSVALVERRDVGGVCLNRGCIPAKALLHSGELAHNLKDAKRHGIKLGEWSVELGEMVKRKNGVVERLRKGVETLCKQAKVEIVRGTGSLAGANAVKVAGGEGKQTLETENIIVATGSVPAVPKAFPTDRGRVMTSDEALDLAELPESVLIVGGGYIGCEFATFFAALGVKVVLVEMLERILPMNEPEIASVVRKQLEKEGVEIHTATKVESLEVRGEGVHAELGEAGSCDVTRALISTGRRPVTEGLELEAAGVKLDDQGFVAIDEWCRTNVKNIYAIGDVTGKVQLAHVASRQGIVAGNNLLGREDREDYTIVPSAVYTYPEVASVGLMEEQCKERGLEYRSATFSMRASGMALAYDRQEGFVKLLAGRRDEILGAHIVCPHAYDVVQEVAMAMRSECTLVEIADTIHAHPTFVEAVSECANKLLGRVSHG